MTNAVSRRADRIPPDSNERLLTALRVPLWKQALAFIIGFCLQFNVLIGGGGEGAAATGGYGFRIFDYLSVALFVLLCLQALAAMRIISLTIFCLMVGALILVRILEPTFWSDPRTVILGEHYVAYLFTGLYVAILVSEKTALDKFCWGLVCGLVATTPIFIIQGFGYSSTLINLGLVPGYYEVLSLDIGNIPRYSGLWGHPNEAGHIAAIAAIAGAYFASVHRRYIPLCLVGSALIVVFFYTQSRGGVLVGEGILMLSFLFGRAKQISFTRLLASVAVIVISVELVSQLEFVSSRFEGDPSTAGNFAERLSSIEAGLQIALSHPFGLPLVDFYSLIDAATGGVGSPHDGFILFSAIFGWLPLFVLIAALIANLYIRTDVDVFFAFAALQLCLSFMFEQLPVSYSFAFMVCFIIGRAYLKSPVGALLIMPARTYGQVALRGQNRFRRARSVQPF